MVLGLWKRTPSFQIGVVVVDIVIIGDSPLRFHRVLRHLTPLSHLHPYHRHYAPPARHRHHPHLLTTPPLAESPITIPISCLLGWYMLGIGILYTVVCLNAL